MILIIQFRCIRACYERSQQNYTDSHYFKRYLASGRYASQTDGDINSSDSYDMNDTVVKMKIKMSGQVADTGGTVDLSKSANVDAVFGSTNASPDPSQTNVTHLVNSTGKYNINLYLELRHDERF